MSQPQCIHRDDHVVGDGPGNAGHVEEGRVGPIELLHDGIDGTRIGEVAMKVSACRGGRLLDVETDDLATGVRQTLRGGSTDTRRCTRENDGSFSGHVSFLLA